MFMDWSSSTDLNGWVWEKWVQPVFKPADTKDGMTPKGIPASLISLFKRGRYYRPHPGLEGGEGDGSQGRREKERFAAAAMAFLARLDPEGVGLALREVVSERGASGQGGGHLEAAIETEVRVGDRYFDLVLRPESEGLDAPICAVEFKIDAPLEDHQNPSKSAFRADSGYGQLLASGFRGHRIRYVVLGATDCGHPEDGDIEVDGCRVQHAWRSWADLEACLRNRGRSCSELVQLFAFLEIPAFQLMFTNDVKIQPSTLGEAARAHMVLRHAVEDLNLPPSIGKPSFHNEGQSHWYYGVDLMPVEGDSRGKVRTIPAKLARIVRPRPGQSACWFGYTDMPDFEHGVSVWFYCGSEERRSRLETWLKAKFSGAVGPVEKSDERSFDLWVAKAENDPTADREWFVEVIRVAAQMPE